MRDNLHRNVTRITRPHVTVWMQSKSKLTVPLVSLSTLSSQALIWERAICETGWLFSSLQNTLSGRCKWIPADSMFIKKPFQFQPPLRVWTKKPLSEASSQGTPRSSITKTGLHLYLVVSCVIMCGLVASSQKVISTSGCQCRETCMRNTFANVMVVTLYERSMP